MKLGIDIGNYNVKTSEGIIFKSAISENIEFGNHFDKIEIYNKVYYIGTGKLEIDYRKFDKDNYEPLLLAAICKSSNSIENTIGLGLPIKQYYIFKDELRNKLVNKAYDVTFNDIKRRIKIVDVQVFPESVAGIITHYNSTLFDVKNKDIVSVDIGGKTTDIALIRSKKVIYSSQVNVGTIDIYNCIKKSIETKYYDTKINLDDIEDYLKNGFYYKGERQNLNFAIKNCNDLFKEIYTELNLNYPINTSAVVFQGGGTDLLYSVLNKKVGGVVKIEDLFANAKGYKSLLK